MEQTVASRTELDDGRRAVAERAWRVAHDALKAAQQAGALPSDDLWQLALASYLVGEEQDFLDALREAHRRSLDAGAILEAVRASFWLGQHLASRGEMAQASGWFGRAKRLVQDTEAEGASRGYALMPLGYRQLMEGRYTESASTWRQVAEIGRRCGDPDLAAIGTHARGRALLKIGRLEEGLAFLDQAMIDVMADDLTPVASGLIYCSVISACREVWALRRAKEWTEALAEWCASQPDMVAYTGPCRVSRAEIFRRCGKWSEALDEARLALDRYAEGSGPGSPGAALYTEGEVHRLRGAFAAAEAAYGRAREAGTEPQPGFALLRLAQGEAESAAASIRRALAETGEPLRRARLLPAYVEILLELGDTEGASAACEELQSIAGEWGGSVLGTVASQTRGTLLLCCGDPTAALSVLRRAYREWAALDAPYEGARIRLLLAAACEQLNDQEGAEIERRMALRTLRELGADPDVAGAGTPPSTSHEAMDHGLTPREREVLEWLATGRTNRAIAEELSISEKTVARHIANIYGKLGLGSRAAATAYAYEHDLAGPSA